MKKLLAALLLTCMAVSFSATITWRGYKEITSDVTVSSTDNLIIEAGTIVRFAPFVKLTVYGEIKAMGTESEPVLFAALDRGDTQWEGITINSMSGLNEFNYSRFVFMNAATGSGNAGMNLLQSNVTISNCFFRDNYGENGGALKIVGGNVTVTGTTFYYNGAPNGGGIYIYNDSSNGPSSVNINNSKFNHNDAWTAGGAIYVMDNENSANNMQVNISNCLMLDHYSGNGGAFWYESRGKIDMTFKKSRIFSNSADYGSGIYMVFMPHAPGNVLVQRFSNLLIFKNGAWVSAAAYIDMGQTQNPHDIVFTNMTIAYNNIEAVKGSQKNLPAGLHLKSNGNFLKPANSILWGNTANMEPANFMIDDTTMPNPDQVFWYCDLENWFSETNNISSPPLFIRRPADSYAEQIKDPDKYDFHLRLLSPCIDAGDPNEPCFEPNSSRVNIGAYGNTNEAAKGTYNTVFATSNTDVIIGDNTATILDFQGKSGTTAFFDLDLGVNAELYISKAENMDSIIFNNIFTQNGKFDESFVRIQTLDANTPVQNLKVKGTANLYNTDMYNLFLTMESQLGSNLVINNTKFYADSLAPETTPYAIDLINPQSVVIENSKFIDYYGGIRVNPLPMDPTGNKNKATGRIANNSVSFEPTPSNKSKAGAQKMIGIEIANANIDVEDNDIDGGDEGIVMKAGSSGRISNNSVSFEPTASNKGSFVKKGIVVSGGSSSTDISNNIIVNDDWENTLDVIGIEIDNSVGVISYNQLRYGGYDSGPRTGVNLISPQSGTKVYNNTIFGTYTGIGNSSSGQKIDVTNNIFWSWDSTSVQAVNDTTDLRFFNNCFLKGLPAGITGENNFNLDPEFNSDYSGDFTLASTSPCINAGKIIDGVHSFASSKTVYYYGSAPDIGAEEFWQDSQPVEVTTSVSGTDFTFGWDPVPGFTYYKVYESDDPFGTFTVAYHGTATNYTEAVSAKKFYYVTATTDAPTKIYDSRPAVSESNTEAAPTPRERAKQFRAQKQQQSR